MGDSISTATSSPEGELISVSTVQLSIVVCTWNREQIFLQTLNQIIGNASPNDEIIVVDQTANPQPDTVSKLTDLQKAGKIRWLKQDTPNLPAARNRGIKASRNPVVAFIDDDVYLAQGFFNNLREIYGDPAIIASVGQVIPEHQHAVDAPPGMTVLDMEPRSNQPGEVHWFYGCNFNVRREIAMSVGGLDENYYGGAFREESDFALRISTQFPHRRIVFNPRASLVHIHADHGGVRGVKSHLSPYQLSHSFCAWYFVLNPALTFGMRVRLARIQLRSAIWNRHLMAHPHLIPLILVRELISGCKALARRLRGPTLRFEGDGN